MRIQIEFTSLLLATGPGNTGAVRFLSSGSVPFGSKPGQKPEPLCLGGVVTQSGHKPTVFFHGLYPDSGSILRSLPLLLQLSISVQIVSWHHQHVNCAALVALSPPAFRLAIRLIFVEWLWNRGTFRAKLARFRQRLNYYWSDHKSESGRWISGQNCTIYVLIMSRYNQNSNT